MWLCQRVFRPSCGDMGRALDLLFLYINDYDVIVPPIYMGTTDRGRIMTAVASQGNELKAGNWMV